MEYTYVNNSTTHDGYNDVIPGGTFMGHKMDIKK